MPIEMTMPRLSDTMEVGTVVKWSVKEGDQVSSGDVVADIETDKATMELQTFDDGTVAKLLVGEGESVAVGTPILMLAEKGESVQEAAAGVGAAAGEKAAEGRGGAGGEVREPQAAGARQEAVQQTGATEEATTPSAGTGNGRGGTGERRGGGNGRVFASPLARKMAEDEGLDLGALEGSGPSGRIVKKDVEEALARGGAAGAGRVERATEAAGEMTRAASTARGMAVTPAPLALGGALEDRLVPLNNMRGTIARRLVESKTTIPHYQVSVSARMDALLALREQLNEQLEAQGVKLSVNDFVVRACAMAMHEHPFVNSSWAEKNGQPAIQLHSDVNIGVAIALPMEKGGGLVVATLRATDQMGLRQISYQTKALAQKARSKGLSIEEMSDSTFTISNMGMFGVDHFTAIINPPNAAILAVGQAIEKVFIERENEDLGADVTLAVGHEMTMTMSSDHRIIDGAMAAQYLGTVRQYLENPATLLV